MALKIFNCHVAQGWDRPTVKEWILDADNKVRHERLAIQDAKQDTIPPTIQNTNPESSRNCLFLHFEYHQCNIPKEKVRALYDAYCADPFSS